MVMFGRDKLRRHVPTRVNRLRSKRRGPEGMILANCRFVTSGIAGGFDFVIGQSRRPFKTILLQFPAIHS